MSERGGAGTISLIGPLLARCWKEQGGEERDRQVLSVASTHMSCIQQVHVNSHDDQSVCFDMRNASLFSTDLGNLLRPLAGLVRAETVAD
jgi:hypothetical protein